MPAISAPIASEARYWSGARSGRGLNGAARSELIGLGSMPIGGVGRSRAGSRSGAGAGRPPGGTGKGSPVSWKAASRVPRSAFGTRPGAALAPGPVGLAGGPPGTVLGDIPAGFGPEFGAVWNGDGNPAGGG